MAKKAIVQKTSNNQYIVTIPKQIAEFKGIEKGTILYWAEDSEGNLVLKRNIKKKEGSSDDIE